MDISFFGDRNLRCSSVGPQEEPDSIFQVQSIFTQFGSSVFDAILFVLFEQSCNLVLQGGSDIARFYEYHDKCITIRKIALSMLLHFY